MDIPRKEAQNEGLDIKSKNCKVIHESWKSYT